MFVWTNAPCIVRLPCWVADGKFGRFAPHARRPHSRTGSSFSPPLPSAYSSPLLPQLHVKIDKAQIHTLGQTIDSIIDWEVSENENRTCVRPRVSPPLDEMKAVYAGLDNLLSRVALDVRAVDDIPEGWASALNVLYFPQLGECPCSASAMGFSRGRVQERK